MSSVILLVCIFVPLLGAFVLPLAGRSSPWLRNILALVFAIIAFFAAAIALPPAINGTPMLVSWELPLGLSGSFIGDTLAVFMALISSLVSAIIVFYSFIYIEKYDYQNEYYMMVLLFIGAMMGLVFSTNLIFIYMFWELAAVCSWRLIGFFRKEEIVIKADKALLVTVSGALLMLLGFIGIYSQTGTFNLLAIPADTELPTWVMIMLLCGILSKSATLPLHTWLPDAGVAPTPVTALLHAALLVKIGLYMYARMFLVNFIPAPVWETIVPVIAAASALVAGGAALVENDLKRIIAYSTISQLGFILLGLSCGVITAAAGGLLYIMMHSLAKAGLFLCAGNIQMATHTTDIREISGLYKDMPGTGIAFALCAFSVMGIPPMGGFFAKYMVLTGAFEVSPWLAAVFIFGSLLTILYLMRVFIKVFFGTSSHFDVREGSWETLGSVLLLGILSLVFGIFVNLPVQLTEFIVTALGRG